MLGKKKDYQRLILLKNHGINLGHLTHIEKGDRNPSAKTLKDICIALDIPYLPVSYTYDKELTEEQEKFNLLDSIPYNTIPLVDNIVGMAVCPASIPKASFAFVMNDDSMKSSIPKGTTVFIEFGTMPLHREFGLVKYNDSIIVRRFVYRKNKLVLKADNFLTRDISIADGSQFTLIGKAYVEN